jgi:prolycopene isomerase
MLSRAGLKTLLCERQNALGGYAHAFERSGLSFDPAVHWVPQGGEDGLYRQAFKHLGVSELCQFLPIREAYDVRYDGAKSVRVPTGPQECAEEHARAFPAEADGVRRFFEMCHRAHVEIHQLPMRMGVDVGDVNERFPTFLTMLRSTLAEVLDDCVADTEAREVCAAMWPQTGPPPPTASALNFAQILANMLEGSWYPRGGPESMVTAFAAGAERNGGELLVGNGAAKIHFERGAVRGVTLDSGQRVSAPIVVSGADGTHTLLDLVGADELPGLLLKRLRRLKPGGSAFMVYGGTTLDLPALGLGHETFVLPPGETGTAAERIAAGRPAGVWISTASVTDPSMASDGVHPFVITSVAQYDVEGTWATRASAFEHEMLELAEIAIPGLRESVTFVERATPLDYERFTGNRAGASYGWDPTPRQMGTRRLPAKPPLAGLYLVGHWTVASAATLRALASGIQVATLVTRDMGEADAIPTFADANLPAVTN